MATDITVAATLWWFAMWTTFVIGFESHAEATACLEELRARFAKFGLKLHEGKTRLIEFGRYAIERRERRGEGRPETFDFLGFTHCCGKTRNRGWFTVRRHQHCQTDACDASSDQGRSYASGCIVPLGDTSRWLRSVVQGWLNYHAVPGNSQRIGRFVDEVTRLWLHVLRRRSQLGGQRWTWARMHRFVRKHLPRPRILHPYPNERFHARLKVGAV